MVRSMTNFGIRSLVDVSVFNSRAVLAHGKMTFARFMPTVEGTKKRLF
jgi:hypothetical protein